MNDYERLSDTWRRDEAERAQDAAMDDEFAQEREMDALDHSAELREMFGDIPAWVETDAHFEDEQL
jgi:hypothetical protein